MTLYLFNTLTRKKERFTPLNDNIVTMYTCGPTVYDYAHIGNFRAFLFYDTVRRYLKYKGYRVKHVMNITDVDDKTIRRSISEGVSLKEYTEKYTKIFFEELKKLNVERFEYYPKATEHISDMVALIKKLMEKGYAYRGSDGSIYFKISKFKDYGKLSGVELKGLKAGARVSHDEYDKESACDFALWKAWSESDGDVFWETGIGKGRPGWHIECSVMAMKYLGETIDIHCGGVDLIFPHHENEIAQSEAATGKQFVRYWLHNEHVLVDGRKMSKSLGNFFTLRDLEKRGYRPAAIRLLLISSHYRKKLNVTKEALNQGEKNLDRFLNFMEDLRNAEGRCYEGVDEVIKKARERFEQAMDDDLNTPEALDAIFSFMKEINGLRERGFINKEDAKKCMEFMLEVNKVLGILPERVEVPWSVVEKVAEEIKRKFGLEIKVGETPEKTLQAIIELREGLRKERKFSVSDGIRELLKNNGIILEDLKGRTIYKIINNTKIKGVKR